MLAQDHGSTVILSNPLSYIQSEKLTKNKEKHRENKVTEEYTRKGEKWVKQWKLYWERKNEEIQSEKERKINNVV